MVEPNKLTLNQMLELSRRIPDENWEQIEFFDTRFDYDNDDRFEIPNGAIMYRSSHPSGVNIDILSTPTNLVNTEEIGIIRVYSEDGIATGLERFIDGPSPSRNPNPNLEKIKKRYQEILAGLEAEKRRTGYELAMKLLKGE